MAGYNSRLGLWILLSPDLVVHQCAPTSDSIADDEGQSSLERQQSVRTNNRHRNLLDLQDRRVRLPSLRPV